MAVAAQLGDVELISVDSMQVYRGLDIGTAKPSPEDQAAIRHHCIDIAEATAEFTVAEFKRAHASALGHIGPGPERPARRWNRAVSPRRDRRLRPPR